jgi:uncharacterized repeat protein (TIGR03803 family)
MRKTALSLAIAIGFLLMTTSAAWAAATEQVLYSFTDGSDGGYPLAGLVFDDAGNLYGTTSSGGVYDQGTVFEVSQSNGTWSETVLYSFTGGADGQYPASGLLIDKAGNLYGTTQRGGVYGLGTVFELRRSATEWREIVISTFSNGGSEPSGLVRDQAGNAFGTTQAGGAYGRGTVFGMQRTQTGWQQLALYSFGANGTDGITPESGVVLGSGERLYGTTPNGGYGRGTVFELTYSPSGWTEKIIYYFQGGYDGSTPYAGLVIDRAGNLYGTTSSGGEYNDGTVFELTKSAQGWSKAIIYNFNGVNPSTSALTFDQSGNLYGETYDAIFELSPSNGEWTETSFFDFDGTDGFYPNGGLIFDQAGNMYGTTDSGGGVFGAGEVFEITP